MLEGRVKKFYEDTCLMEQAFVKDPSLTIEKVVKDANLTYTKDETNFTITIEWNSTEDFVVSNTTTSTIYVSGVEIIYE
jgi:translation elongation factor EF-Ts